MQQHPCDRVCINLTYSIQDDAFYSLTNDPFNSRLFQLVPNVGWSFRDVWQLYTFSGQHWERANHNEVSFVPLYIDPGSDQVESVVGDRSETCDYLNTQVTCIGQVIQSQRVAIVSITPEPSTFSLLILPVIYLWRKYGVSR